MAKTIRMAAGENYSANWGVEGPTNDKVISEMRARIQRAMLATVMFAHGTPMLLGGDEFGRTQGATTIPIVRTMTFPGGTGTLPKSKEGGELQSFVTKLIAIRRQHPVSAREPFFHG